MKEFTTFLIMPDEIKNITDVKVLEEKIEQTNNKSINELYVKRLYELDYEPNQKLLKKWIKENKINIYPISFLKNTHKFIESFFKKEMPTKAFEDAATCAVLFHISHALEKIEDPKLIEKFYKACLKSINATNVFIKSNVKFSKEQLQRIFIATSDVELSDLIESKIKAFS